MTDTELQLIADSVREFIEEKIRAVRDPLLREIEALQEQFRSFEPPRDGKDIDPEIVKLAIAGEVTRQIAEIPKPKDGVSPAPVDMVQVKSLVDDAVILAVEALPRPKDGVDGKDGQNGRDGIDGIPGKDGAPGLNGRDGESIKGERGEPGIAGRDGVDGARGIDGLNGKDGADGINGKDAEPIHPDTIRMMVTEEARKAVAELPKVKDGERGEPGRDAFELDILPSLDRTRSVPRGTVARHAGGILRAFRDTEPSKDGDGHLENFGWETVFDGISGIDLIHGDDIRSFALQITRTSGKSSAFQFQFPVVLDEGVFKDGNEYRRGAGTTYDGSFWICQADTTKARPGTSPDWRLAVKRGGEGKPGKSAIEPPKPGPVRLQ